METKYEFVQRDGNRERRERNSFRSTREVTPLRCLTADLIKSSIARRWEVSQKAQMR